MRPFAAPLLSALSIAAGAPPAQSAEPGYWVEHGKEATCIRVTGAGPGSSTHTHACVHYELPLYTDDRCSVVSTDDPCKGLDFRDVRLLMGKGGGGASSN